MVKMVKRSRRRKEILDGQTERDSPDHSINLLLLPEEILSNILSNLSLFELIRIRQVSAGWKSIAERLLQGQKEFIFRYNTTRDGSLNGFMINGCLVLVSEEAPNEKAIFELLARYCPNITLIDTKNVFLSYHYFVQFLADRFRQLRELTFSYCEGLTDGNVHLLADQCPEITTLILSGQNLRDNGLYELFKRLTLERVSLAEMRNMKGRCLMGLQGRQLFSRRRQTRSGIRQLEIMACPNLQMDYLKPFFKENGSRLSFLTISTGQWLSAKKPPMKPPILEKMLVVISEYLCLTMETLNIRLDPDATPHPTPDYGMIGKLKNLRTLRIEPSISNNQLILIIENCKCLTKLILCGKRLTDKSIRELGGLKFLKVLEIHNNKITGRSLEGISHLKGLKRISLPEKMSLEDEPVAKMVEKCENLTMAHLNYSGNQDTLMAAFKKVAHRQPCNRITLKLCNLKFINVRTKWPPNLEIKQCASIDHEKIIKNFES